MSVLQRRLSSQRAQKTFCRGIVLLSVSAFLFRTVIKECFLMPAAHLSALQRQTDLAFQDSSHLLLAAGIPENELTEFEKNGPDTFFYVFIIVSLLVIVVSLYIITKPYWEQRWLIEKINAQKLKFITEEEGTTPLDQFELGRMYNSLQDYPSALAEFEEAEEDFDDVRQALNPEDTIGALAARAQLHNSKGFALMKLEPPRTAQARREFVRAVTYWPEYPEALLNIGRELMKRKRFDVAVRTLNTALKWRPGSQVMQGAASEARRGMETQLAEDEEDE
jgi:tetratricopeptide (TPR) repeat protein